MKLTNEELAYFAGIIDGEGCFTIEIQPPASYRKGTLYTCRLTITNTDQRLLKWLLNKIGGKLFTRKLIEGRKQCYSWRIYAIGIDEIIPKVIPYLICKKEEAILIMKFRGSFEGRGVKNTPEVCAFREQCLKDLKLLNHLGS